MNVISLLMKAAAGAAFILMAGHASGQQLHELKVGLASESLLAAAPKIANELGLFKKYGLEPKFVVLGSSNMATTALISGAVNFALSTPPDTIVAAGQGQKVLWLATMYQGFGVTLTLSKSAADKLKVAAAAPLKERYKALDGLTIASPSPTSPATIAPRAAADSAGANVKFVYMPFTSMPASLEAGAIDGYVASSPVWAIPVLKGTGVVWLSGPKGEFPSDSTPAANSVFQVMKDYAEANPEITRNVARIFDDLVQAIRDRPADVRAAAARLFPDLDAKMFDYLYDIDVLGFAAPPPSADLVAHEIMIVKKSGIQLPQIDSLTPASIIYQRN